MINTVAAVVHALVPAVKENVNENYKITNTTNY